MTVALAKADQLTKAIFESFHTISDEADVKLDENYYLLFSAKVLLYLHIATDEVARSRLNKFTANEVARN
ncbi:MAG: hypothetical protein R3B45_02985 [Bdellovibrionota bacterium]